MEKANTQVVSITLDGDTCNVITDNFDPQTADEDVVIIFDSNFSACLIVPLIEAVE
ncbi:hypothetical protein [Thalassotalea agarivorans]|uniref:Uncharacterized protein n=1 Tax=Thalassotalea agarivorans TaxID=349064 RepID=A0A1I0F1G9_THASX|nr:hypothetical protein [Thalassotalea agarivorans]SET51623.1 hypothetical protein SAMN05660429_02023 [Thalassotalea agarivorans]